MSGGSWEPRVSFTLLKPLRPDSARRVAFDVCSIVILFLELTQITCVLAWDSPLTSTIQTLQWCGAIFWTVDLLSLFNTGYYEDLLILDRRRIAVSHLKSWFVVDVILVLFDWGSIALTHTDNKSGQCKTT